MFNMIMKLASEVFKGFLNGASGFGWYRNKYSSQVKALKSPYTSCFSHSVCWLMQNTSDKFKDFTPDRVTTEINSKKYQDWTKVNLGRSVLRKFKGNLNQLWDVQKKYIQDQLDAKGINKTVTWRRVNSPDMLRTVIKTSQIVVATAPKVKATGKTLGHIMSIVDFKKVEDDWIIDDSYGDFRVGYDSGHVGKGNDLRENVMDFEKIRTGLCLYIY